MVRPRSQLVFRTVSDGTNSNTVSTCIPVRSLMVLTVTRYQLVFRTVPDGINSNTVSTCIPHGLCWYYHGIILYSLRSLLVLTVTRSQLVFLTDSDVPRSQTPFFTVSGGITCGLTWYSVRSELVFLTVLDDISHLRMRQVPY